MKRTSFEKVPGYAALRHLLRTLAPDTLTLRPEGLEATVRYQPVSQPVLGIAYDEASGLLSFYLDPLDAEHRADFFQTEHAARTGVAYEGIEYGSTELRTGETRRLATALADRHPELFS